MTIFQSLRRKRRPARFVSRHVSSGALRDRPSRRVVLNRRPNGSRTINLGRAFQVAQARNSLGGA